MKRSILIAILALACSGPPTKGVVTSKQYHAAYSYVQIERVGCGATDKYGNCMAPIYYPHTYYVPESWELCLRDDSEDKPIKDQATGCVDIDGQTWQRYRPGEHYP